MNTAIQKWLLREVTLCAVASRHPQLALRALQISSRNLAFGDILLCAPASFACEVPASIRWSEIPIFDSVRQYSSYVLSALAPQIRTSHVLIVQWDGFVLHPDAWDETFLEYDYIGAVWPQYAADRDVGNGGFSLRSRRLLTACLDARFEKSHPEDLCICHQNRTFLEQEYGIRIAPASLAARFSYERSRPEGTSFGFHGLFNFPDIMDAATLRRFLAAVPAEVLRGRDSLDLCARLLRSGQAEYLPVVQRLLAGQSAASYKPSAWLKMAVRFALCKAKGLLSESFR